MDNTLAVILIGAVAVIALSVMALRLDRSRLRRERQRHDTSQAERLLDTTVIGEPAPRALPPAADDPRIEFGSPTRAGETVAQTQPAPAPRSSQIIFGPVPDSAAAAPPTNPIRFGEERSDVARKCPACHRPTKSGDSVMECKRCHLHFHVSPCWEEFVQDRQKPCPRCASDQFERLTLT